MERRHFLQAMGAVGAGVIIPVLSPSAAYASLPVLSYGSRSSAVADLQRKLGGLPVTGRFLKLTLGRVIDFQISKGLRPDGVVGPLSWAYLNQPNKAVTGTPFLPRANRIVNDKRNNAVYLVRADGRVERWGWSVDNDVKTPTGVTTVSQKIRVNRNLENEQPGKLDLNYFTRFNGGNGFHAIPINRDTGLPIHGVGELGRGTAQRSLGCVRLAPDFAVTVYNWAHRGMQVHTLSRL